MKMHIYHVLSLLLATILLVACAQPAATGTPTAGAVEPVTGQSSATAATTAAPNITATTPAQAATVTATAAPVAGEPAGKLTVITHDSFAVSDNVIKAFEQANNVQVTFIKSGDAGAALNRVILTKDAPIADVFYGVDNTFLSRALDAGIYAPYNAPELANMSSEFKLDPQNRALPVDYGDVCINYDKAYFTDKKLPVPQSLDDLKKPEYKGLLVVENPATSSPGLAFLLATIAQYGQDGYLQYWKDLRANGVVVVSGWEAAYYTNFSGSSGRGSQPMVVSYASSPVAEVVYAKNPPADAPTASIVATNACFRQIEFVGILKGTKQRALAEKFVDFMLSKQFQEDMPLQMFVYPVNPQAALPDSYKKFAQVPEKPATMDPAVIAKNRDAWVQAWEQAVLR